MLEAECWHVCGEAWVCKGGKVVSPTHCLLYPLPLPHEISLVLVSGLSRPQAHIAAGSIELVTSSGVESVTRQIVVQCLNQMRHRVPQ